MRGIGRKFLLWLSLGLVMLSSAWMGQEKCCVPGYAHGPLNEAMLIVALELTPDYEGWSRYLKDTTCIDDPSAGRHTAATKIACLRTQIRKDLLYIASYTFFFMMMVHILFRSGWRRMAGWVLTGMIAVFDLLENLFIHYTLCGFENAAADVGKTSKYIAAMFDFSLSKWTLLMLLILWLFHAAVRLKGWWFDAGKLGLLGSIMLFLWMPVWDLTQPVQVPSVVLIVYLAVLVIVFVTVLIKPPGSRRNA